MYFPFKYVLQINIYKIVSLYINLLFYLNSVSLSPPNRSVFSLADCSPDQYTLNLTLLSAWIDPHIFSLYEHIVHDLAIIWQALLSSSGWRVTSLLNYFIKYSVMKLHCVIILTVHYFRICNIKSKNSSETFLMSLSPANWPDKPR